MGMWRSSGRWAGRASSCCAGGAARRIRAAHAQLGFGLLSGLLQFGPLPHDQTVRSMELFARKVIPELRSL